MKLLQDTNAMGVQGGTVALAPVRSPSRNRAEELLAQQQAQRALALAEEERDRQKTVAEDRALFAEQMMAVVSHDLRNPLSVIRMSAHIIGMSEPSSNQLPALGRLNASTPRG
jgi:sigma-B regulation protein RsbU (phosphoserine phosphatase)